MSALWKESLTLFVAKIYVFAFQVGHIEIGKVTELGGDLVVLNIINCRYF